MSKEGDVWAARRVKAARDQGGTSSELRERRGDNALSGLIKAQQVPYLTAGEGEGRRGPEALEYTKEEEWQQNVGATFQFQNWVNHH